MAIRFTVDNALKYARDILQDQDKDRYADQRLIEALNMAIAEMIRLRPDIVALSQPIPDYPFKSTDVAQGKLLPVGDQYFTPIVSFIAGWAELADDEFTVDNRAGILLTRFQSQLTMGG